MKKYEEKYRKSCTFVSIDCFDSPETWKAGLEKHQMPWIHVYNPDDAPLDKNATVLYGVQGYPTKIIINPEGAYTRSSAARGPTSTRSWMPYFNLRHRMTGIGKKAGSLNPAFVIA